MGPLDTGILLPEINTTKSCCYTSFTPPIHIDLESHKTHLSSVVIIIIAILGGCFLLVSYYAIIVKYCTNFSHSRAPQAQIEEDSDVHEDFVDENHGPVLDHPIWYIHTVGLAQGVIDSIGVLKYNKGEGLLEGTDCSICLSEFEEDETLRLLPKCSHAFHVSCIDTWLRSHTNCPSCRAPVVATPTVSASTVVTPNGEETQGEDPEGQSGLGTGQIEEGRVTEFIVSVAEEGEDEDKIRDAQMSKEDVLSPLEMSNFRVLSDLSVNHRLGQDRRQPVRRSASMDFIPASIFCFSVANSPPLEEEEVEGGSVAQMKSEKKLNLAPGAHRLMGSSSKGGLLPISSVSMKRSLSTGGKLVPSRLSRNRSSILPL